MTVASSATISCAIAMHVSASQRAAGWGTAGTDGLAFPDSVCAAMAEA